MAKPLPSLPKRVGNVLTRGVIFRRDDVRNIAFLGNDAHAPREI
jgi:hypothetical protein